MNLILPRYLAICFLATNESNILHTFLCLYFPYSYISLGNAELKFQFKFSIPSEMMPSLLETLS